MALLDAIRELKLACRALRRAPVATAAAVVTLALGLGATTAVYSLVDAALFEPLAFARSERVVKAVLTRPDRGGRYAVAYHNFVHWRDESRSFAALAAVRERVLTLPTPDGGGARLSASEVSPSYFAVAGVEPLLGRGLGPVDVEPGAPPVAVLGWELWQSRFAGDPAAVGRPLALREGTYTVVGVMPRAARDPLLGWRELWTPLAVDEAAALAQPLWGFDVLGRLAPGVSLDEARADLAAVARRLEEEHPQSNQGWGVEMHPVRRWLVEEVERPLWIVLATVAAVLLIAAVNVANLFLARGTGRRREAAVRRALGAGRGTLLRGFLLESGLTGLAGGAGGLALAAVGLRLSGRLAPAHLPAVEAAALDGRVLGVALALSLAAGVGSGLLPALRLAATPADGLRAGRAVLGERGGGRLSGLLVSAEVAAAAVVMIAASLLGQSWARVRQVDPGFDPRRLLTLRFELPAASHADKAERIARFQEVLQRVEALPGVARAGASGAQLPLLGGQGAFELFVEGQPRRATPEHVVTAQMVSPSYFEAMGIRLVAGRLFDPLDTWEASHSVVVNETLARRFWPPGEAVGKWVEWKSGDRGWVIGVVGDVRQLRVDRAAAAEAYLAWGSADLDQALVVRAATPASLAAAVRREVLAAAPGATVWGVRTGEELVAASTARRRFTSLAIGVLGALALALGTVGVYGVVAHATSRRMREVALRSALGAEPARIARLVLASGMVPVVRGLLLGVLLALAGGPLLASQLYEVSAADPASFAVAASSLLAAGLAACAVPARRALRLDPTALLRTE